MNEPDDQGAVTHQLPKILVTPDPPEEAPPALAGIEPPGDGVLSVEPPAVPPPLEELPAEELPLERHDPFAYMRNAPWMDRRLSPSGRGAILLRRDLDAFPVIEGRDPNLADLKAIAQRTVDYIVPIIKREQLTDYAYEVLEEQRQARIAKRQSAANETGRPEHGFIKVSGDNLDLGADSKATPTKEGAPAEIGPSLAQLGPEARNERIRAQKWSEPSSDREHLKSLEQFRGREVRLPDGSRVPDPYSPTGYLMSPVEDLRHVAAAGRAAGRTIVGGGAATLAPGGAIPSLTILEKVYEQARAAIAQGGEFDYQRKAAVGEKSGFVQLRQFRNVSNFNVGLFMQQAKFPLKATLWIAGQYAKRYSSNYASNEEDGLEKQTREFIERGYAAGESGVFD